MMDNNLCRACLELQGKISLKDDRNREMLLKQFSECTGIQIHKIDATVPSYLCIVCVEKLEISYSFRRQCLNSDAVIQKRLKKVADEHSKKTTCSLNVKKVISDNKINVDAKEKNIQEMYYPEEFQFVFKPRQKKKNRLTKYICEVCGYCAKDMYTLKLHCNTHNTNVEKHFPCQLCHKKFSTKVSLKSHISRHMTSNSLLCEECGVRFSAKANLLLHQKSFHTGLRAYACDSCPKSFSTRSNLTVHRRVHAGVKPHKCQTCNKAFNTTSDLKGHMRSHSGEKPYVCKVCNKGFTLSSNLSVHLRKHNNALVFKCTQCEHKFNSKASLKSHQRIHSGVRLHECSICSARFTHPNTLKLHMTVHTGARDFQCSICDKRFSRASILKNHSKKHDQQRVDKNNSSRNKAMTNTSNSKENSHINVINSSVVNKDMNCMEYLPNTTNNNSTYQFSDNITGASDRNNTLIEPLGTSNDNSSYNNKNEETYTMQLDGNIGSGVPIVLQNNISESM